MALELRTEGWCLCAAIAKTTCRKATTGSPVKVTHCVGSVAK